MLRFCKKLKLHKFLKTYSPIRPYSFTRVIKYDNLNVGDEIHGYEVTRIVPVSELFLTAIEFKHLKTNSSHLHLDRNDDNNCFNISFTTTPMDDTGVAHILEHVALCGSDNFPVRDPFFKMINRSMATFMNAMTGSDYTMYPFSTQSPVDFKNLLSVYLDATLFPRLRHIDFLQEGWRLEHQDINDQESPIVLKGVVFNEMKGLLTDSENTFSSKMQQHILPDHTYGCYSGGDPLKIPSLTWEDLKKFHSTHYHPSNARVITYGNFPVQEHLQQINEVLDNFTAIDPDTAVPLHKRWSKPHSVQISGCPNQMADPEKQSTSALCFLLTDVQDIHENFALFVLSQLLLEGPNAPFYQSLIESGIGSAYSPSSGYHNHQKESYFSVGLQGLQEKDLKTVRDEILKTIDNVIENGFTKDHIAGILHGIELKIKHQSSQFGIGLSFNTMPTWQHGADPIAGLKINELIDTFKESLLKSDTYLQDLCKKYFKSNTHNLAISMIPDKNFEQKFQQDDLKMGMEKTSKLTKEDMNEIYNNGLSLAKDQSSIPNVECLPTLRIDDIPKISKKYSCELQMFENNIQIASFPQPTNGVTYFRALRTLNHLPDDLVPYLPIFCNIFTQLGTEKRDYKEFQQLQDLYTGGLSAQLHVFPGLVEPSTTERGVIFGGHCLEQNIDTMFELLQELMNSANLRNGGRIQTLIREQAQDAMNSVPYNGHAYAMLSASSQLTPYRQLSEGWNGLSQVRLLQQVAQQTDIDSIIEKLQQINNYIFHAMQNETTRCSVHSTATANKQSINAIENLLKNVNLKTANEEIATDFIEPNTSFTPEFRPTHGDFVQHVLPMPVNFAACSINTYAPYASPANSVLKILGRLLTNKYLLKEIREVGGAYGCGAKQGHDGVFELFSYRDPHSLETLDRFQKGISWLCKGSFSETDVDEAKLGYLQQLDTPVSPCNQGIDYFFNGVTRDMKQSQRNKLLGVTRKDIIQAAKTFLLKAKDTNVAIIGGENTDIKNDKKWTVKS